jgi:hypothetical protein
LYGHVVVSDYMDGLVLRRVEVKSGVGRHITDYIIDWYQWSYIVVEWMRYF